MRGKRLAGTAAGTVLLCLAGCCTWCHNHCPQAQPVAVAPAAYAAPAACCPPPACCPTPACYPTAPYGPQPAYPQPTAGPQQGFQRTFATPNGCCN